MGMGSADKYKMNIENTKKIVEDGEWMFVAAIILNYTIIWMNNMPGYYKEQCMGMGNVRANQKLFRAAAGGAEGETPAAILYTTGKEGGYNRSQRAIAHFLENSWGFIMTLPLGYLTFPFPTFVISVVYSLGRVIYQFGYVKGFGWHYLGFYPFQLSQFTLIALMWLAFFYEKDMEMEGSDMM